MIFAKGSGPQVFQEPLKRRRARRVPPGQGGQKPPGRGGATLFVPQLNWTRDNPHPLVLAFARAALASQDRRQAGIGSGSI